MSALEQLRPSPRVSDLTRRPDFEQTRRPASSQGANCPQLGWGLAAQSARALGLTWQALRSHRRELPGGPIVSPDLVTGHVRYGRGMTRLPLSVVAGRMAPNTPSPGRNGPRAPIAASPLGPTQTTFNRPHSQMAGLDHCLGIQAFIHRTAAATSACPGLCRGCLTRASVPGPAGPINSAL